MYAPTDLQSCLYSKTMVYFLRKKTARPSFTKEL